MKFRLEKEIDLSIKAARKLGVDPEDAPAIARLREELAEAMADVQAEADVYGHLADFFSRYYSEGDFLSLRRYSSGGNPTYLIPYDGEEVKLHWANSDQYYVKTADNYASYAFIAGEGAAQIRVRFETTAADCEKDNIKAANGRQRRFLLTANATTIKGEDLVARFEYRPLTEGEQHKWPGNGTTQQDRINADTASRILAFAEKTLSPEHVAALDMPAPTADDPTRTILAKHVGRYTAKNSFDYFIHKDLGGFLRRELDLYLKTDVLDLQDLTLGDSNRLRRALARMRTVRAIGDKLITFLAQLEDFQKRLWLKKKFVLETQWCVTLDRIPNSFYSEIAANDAQLAEWQTLLRADGSKGDSDHETTGPSQELFTDHPVASHHSEGKNSRVLDLLTSNPYLMLDTHHFDADFTQRLLTAISDSGSLEAQIDGFLVHGENFQALNLLQTRYGEQIKCIYIDPPYNTGADSFLYKDGYQASSWASMLVDRAHLARHLLSTSGLFFVQVGDEEGARSRLLLDLVFPERKNTAVVRRGIKNVQAQFNDIDRLTSGYDVVHIYAGSSNLRIPHLVQKHAIEKPGKWDTFWRGTDRHTLRYEIFGQTPETGQWRWERLRTETAIRNYQFYFREWSQGKTLDEWYLENLQSGIDLDFVRCNGNNVVQYYIPPQGHRLVSDSWLDVSTGGAFTDFETEKHVELVQRIVAWNAGRQGTVLDYFAGSGTTGHAVIALNREDGGRRKYALVEMGQHFDTVLLPRLKRAAYSPDWRNGKPASHDKGVSHLIQYVRLESYEDTLDGLVVTSPPNQLLAENNPTMVEDYRLHYALNAETADSPCLLGGAFSDPFSYKLAVIRDGKHREAPVDLPETFSLLLGLRVEARRLVDGILAITGKDPQGHSCLVLWRNLNVVNNSALNRWFTARRSSFPDKLDLIFTNGDHTLNAVRSKEETWTAKIIEPLFRELMFKVGH